MTADGPDKGTPEYEAAYTIDTPTGARFYYRNFLRHLTNEEKKKFVSQLGDYQKTNTAPFQQFAELTGPLPKKNGERQKLLTKIYELTKTGYYPYLITYLQSMQDNARYSNLIEAYNKGKIQPQLLAILEEETIIPEEYQYLPEIGILQKMLEAGKLNFEPFRHKRDIETNWYNFYRIALHPLPTARQSIKKIAATNEFNYRGTIEHLKTQVKILLEGERPSPAMLERTGGQGADTYVIPPVEPEKLTAFAELIEEQHQRQVKEQTALDFNAPFTQAIDTGFYINPETCIITDLRPYQKELHALLSLKSWDYLKDFADTIREAVKEFTEPAKEETAGDGILQSLFPDVYYAPPEEAKNFRNLPVSKAEKRLIPAYASARIDGQGITLADSDGNPLQEIDFTDLNGNVSDEIIRPFDISIMNCIGSLQQKYPDKKGFTDIQIAKEFCSTQDKKGHITPASPIVKEVREAMRRLRIVFGRIDITEQIKKEAGRRHPDQKKIDKLVKGSKFFGIAQPLVNVTKVAIQTLKNDKDTLLYIIDGPPLFYLHAAITHQIAPVPYEQMNSKKNLTTEIRLLREQTRIALETAISMRKRKVGGDRIRFNTILDATFRTSADEPQDPAKVEITQVVERIKEHIRWKLQRQILQYLDELIDHGFIKSYTVLKKKLAGKRKLVEYGFTFTLPEEPTPKKSSLPPNP